MENKTIPKLRFNGFSGEWINKKLNDIADITLGHSPKGENYTDDPNDYILVQGNADMKNGWVKPRVWTKQITKLASPGDIILSVRAPVGEVGKTGFEVVIGRGVASIKGNEFVYQNLKKMKVDDYWRLYSSGSTFESINSSDLKNAFISIPNKDEQQKIGEFFKQFDDRIALQQRQIELLKESKQGFLQKMFPKDGERVPEVRFDGFSGTWEESKAESIFTSVSDKNHTDLPILSASQKKGMVYRDDNGIDIKYDVKSTNNYKRVVPGQFVIHLRSFQGGFAYSNIEGITSPAYTIIDFRNKQTQSYYFWKNVLTSNNFIKRLETVTYGIRDGKSISFSDFSTLKFKFPSIEEQQKIGEFFKQLDDNIALHEKELELLKETKKGFLQKMFV
ncbi:restriction endonuclease subunit S [Salipaludibacillus sp. HK11]|uniref:restriction endonuclease subunit S n=1 Tax=Salipaludibacillus sp. HK11 TaxID=3394320 RepID=UPI0039FD89A1